MKFLCENCKAKYQIGDDKVAGKTVRMKCRRCGHLIEVSASVTETSASRPPPADPAAPAPEIAPAAASSFAHPGASIGDEDSDEHTVIMQSPPVRLAKPAAPGPAAGAPPRPAAGAPPRPGAVALRAVPSPRPTGNVAIASAPVAARAPAAAEQPGIRALDAPLGIVPKATPSPQPVGVAGAFTRAVSQPLSVAPTSPSRPTPSEDWYVGVGGVPLGPIRLSVIREKAGAGAVDGDSLVWREGFDEWQPLKNFPELLEIVTEAQSSRMGGRRPSGQPAAPGLSHPTPAPAAVSPRAEPSSVSHGDGRHSLSEMARLAASSSAPVAPAPAVSSPSVDPFAKPAAAAALDLLSDPFAAPAPARPAEPVMAPAPTPRLSSHDLAPDSLVGGQRRRRGLHPMAYAFIAMAGVFGAVAAYVLLVKPPPAPQVVYVPGATVIVHDQASAPDATGATTVAAASADSSAPSTRPIGGGGPARVADAKSAAPAAGSPGAGIDMSGFGSSGVQGPSAQGPSAAGASAGGGQLTAGDISSVVNSNQTIIKRKCWQAALDAKTKENVNSAKVTASLTIGPSGEVTSVSASGGEGAFPGLSSCIASRIKSWKFPPSGGSTPVSVPFVFAGQ